MYYLKREDYEQIRTWSKQSSPYECCGLLAGKRTSMGILIKPIRAVNVSTSPANSFVISGSEIKKIQIKVRQSNLQFIGCFHSHVQGVSQPSKRDELSVLKGRLWLIYSVRYDTMCGYLWNGEVFKTARVLLLQSQ